MGTACRRRRSRHPAHIDPLRRDRALEKPRGNSHLCLLRHASAETFASAIRNHWAIENRNHWVRDVTLAEDASRIRINPGVMARLRSHALNIARANGVANVAKALWSAAINPTISRKRDERNRRGLKPSWTGYASRLNLIGIQNCRSASTLFRNLAGRVLDEVCGFRSHGRRQERPAAVVDAV